MNKLFLHQTWLKTNKVAKLMLRPDFKILHKSSMKAGHSRGRPFGGTAWLFNKKISERVQITFYDDCLSVCKIDDDICIVGVYMKYNNGKPEAMLEHEEQISKILDIVENI
ncbi:hypothetical protein BpHYR1_012146 [Brachionus plicatilis]|uniref:Uncharacterized protein n=1 Tax=Brachionus plicatilis TaxID=10195 RepID=A0A3M7R8L7_BRAPC|nr:hypothetical protein BpHYR1_012146 [Brachionus plicatilis]